MKNLFFSVVLFFSSFTYGFSPQIYERPIISAELSEIDSLGNWVPYGAKYVITLNQRDGLTHQASSFQLCKVLDQGEWENCKTFWVTKAKEQLRCDTVRYTASQLGNYPTGLVVDESEVKSECEVASAKENVWEVYLFSGNELSASLRGFPKNE